MVLRRTKGLEIPEISGEILFTPPLSKKGSLMEDIISDDGSRYMSDFQELELLD